MMRFARPLLTLVAVAMTVAFAGPVRAQVSTKPGGTIHGRITHVDRHPGRHRRDARGRYVACARKPHGRSR